MAKEAPSGGAKLAEARSEGGVDLFYEAFGGFPADAGIGNGNAVVEL